MYVVRKYRSSRRKRQSRSLSIFNLPTWPAVRRGVVAYCRQRPRLLIYALPAINAAIALLIASMLPIGATSASSDRMSVAPRPLPTRENLARTAPIPAMQTTSREAAALTTRQPANPEPSQPTHVLGAIAQQVAARKAVEPDLITLPGDTPAVDPNEPTEVVFIPTVTLEKDPSPEQLAAIRVDRPAEPARKIIVGTKHDAPTTDAHRVAYVVDISGSLVDSLADVILWVGNAMDKLERPTEFTVIFFRKDEVLEAPPVGLKRNSFHTKATVYSWMQLDSGNVKPVGQSDVADALAAALKYDVDEVYILSDDGFGRQSDWGTDTGMISNLGRMVGDRQVKINTVQFYYRDPAGALEAIADRFGGEYRFINTKGKEQPRFVIDLFGEMADAR